MDAQTKEIKINNNSFKISFHRSNGISFRKVFSELVGL